MLGNIVSALIVQFGKVPIFKFSLVFIHPPFVTKGLLDILLYLLI